MKVKKAEMWACSNCGTEHDEEDDAIDCCPPEPEKLEAWACGECGQKYIDRDDAKECCKE